MKQYKKTAILCSIILFLLILTIFALLLHEQSSSTTDTTASAADANTSDTLAEQVTSAPLTASQFIEKINVGWNLGNSLDSCVETGRNDGTRSAFYYETAWGNPPVTRELIDSVSNAGFHAIRIPVTWYYNTYVNVNQKLCIRETWLKRVKEVVDYAMANDMYVILDSHHDEFLIWADAQDIDEVSSNVASLWEQIAIAFKDYDEHLLFEGFNELNDRQNSWHYRDELAESTNVLNQVFVDTVRRTGGYNKERILVCSTLLNESSEEILNSFSLPTDTVKDRLLIDIHSYSTLYNQDIDALFQSLEAFSQKQQAPVIIGEFGTTNHFVPLEYRPEHAGNYIARAGKYHLKCFWWDDGLDYKLFNRTDCAIAENNIIRHLMHPQQFETTSISANLFNSIDQYEYASISPDNGELIPFSQGALTLNIGILGYPVSPEYGYHIELTAKDEADGIRIREIALYDAHGNFLSYQDIKGCRSYDITPNTDTCYLKVTLYNDWGYRSRNDYETYLTQGSLYLEISEYKK